MACARGSRPPSSMSATRGQTSPSVYLTSTRSSGLSQSDPLLASAGARSPQSRRRRRRTRGASPRWEDHGRRAQLSDESSVASCGRYCASSTDVSPVWTATSRWLTRTWEVVSIGPSGQAVKGRWCESKRRCEALKRPSSGSRRTLRGGPWQPGPSSNASRLRSKSFRPGQPTCEQAARRPGSPLSQASPRPNSMPTRRVLTTAVGHEGFAAQVGLSFNSLWRSHIGREVRSSLASMSASPRFPTSSESGATARAFPDPRRGCAREHRCAVTGKPRPPSNRARPARLCVDSSEPAEAATTVEAYSDAEPFDAVICLSTVEHLGLPVYGQPASDPDADIVAVSSTPRSPSTGGLAGFDNTHGSYGRGDSHRTDLRCGTPRSLLAPFVVIDRRTVQRDEGGAWMPSADDTAPGVTLITARREA